MTPIGREDETKRLSGQFKSHRLTLNYLIAVTTEPIKITNGISKEGSVTGMTRALRASHELALACQ